jgi:acetylornithine deacetylase/succinyl-diaminopimelate desuccinylase-like protein
VHGGDALVAPIDNVYIRAAARALKDEWGRDPVFERSGGSIPIGALFDQVLKAPVVFLGAGLPDDNIHAPNEKFHLPYFYRDINQIVRFLSLIGNDPAIVARPRASTARRAPAKANTAKA